MKLFRGKSAEQEADTGVERASEIVSGLAADVVPGEPLPLWARQSVHASTAVTASALSPFDELLTGQGGPTGPVPSGWLREDDDPFAALAEPAHAGGNADSLSSAVAGASSTGMQQDPFADLMPMKAGEADPFASLIGEASQASAVSEETNDDPFTALVTSGDEEQAPEEPAGELSVTSEPVAVGLTDEAPPVEQPTAEEPAVQEPEPELVAVEEPSLGQRVSDGSIPVAQPHGEPASGESFARPGADHSIIGSFSQGLGEPQPSAQTGESAFPRLPSFGESQPASSQSGQPSGTSEVDWLSDIRKGQASSGPTESIPVSGSLWTPGSGEPAIPVHNPSGEPPKAAPPANDLWQALAEAAGHASAETAGNDTEVPSPRDSADDPSWLSPGSSQ